MKKNSKDLTSVLNAIPVTCSLLRVMGQKLCLAKLLPFQYSLKAILPPRTALPSKASLRQAPCHLGRLGGPQPNKKLKSSRK